MKSKASCLSKIGMGTIWIFSTGKSGIILSDKMATRTKKICENNGKESPAVKTRTHRKSRHS